MGLGTQTSLLRSLEGKGGGVLISHCFWPDQHTPSPVKGPPAVYNFQELDKPLDQRESDFTSLSLYALKLQAALCHQTHNIEVK